MDEVIRQDVIQLVIDSDLTELIKLKKMLDELKKDTEAGVGDDTFDDLKNGAKDTVSGIKKLKDATDGLNDKLNALAKKGVSAAYNGLKRLAGLSFKSLIAGAAAVGAAVTGAVSAYAEFEQLEGGMKKIFDEADTSGIMKDANNAYKDLGLSANDYLRTINDVGATLAASMGDQAGYNAAKTGLQAISDYASGTGKSVDELSEKFTLITRSTSSYQSIADQFSGILPATSKDFLKQAQNAGLLSKKYTELTKVPVAEYQAAISEMLKKGVKDLGLSGNTAAEASSTISGSLGMLKAAWGNLMPALIEGGDSFEQCVDNLVSSASAFAKNIVPAIKKGLSGTGDLIRELAPVISDELPELMDDLLPDLMNAAADILEALVDALPELLPNLAKSTAQIAVRLGKSLVKNAGALFKAVKEIAGEVVKTLYEEITGKPMGEGAFNDLKATIDKVFGSVSKITTGIKNFASAVWDKIGPIIPGVLDKLVDAFGFLADHIDTLIPLVLGLVGAFKGFRLVTSVASGISSVAGVFGNLKGSIGGLFGKGAGGAGGDNPVSGLTQKGGLFDTLNNMKLGDLLKNIGKIAFVLAALAGAVYLLGLLAKEMRKQEMNAGDILALVGIMAAVGLVGGAIAKVAGIVGAIPITVVLKGIAGIAIAIAGIGLIIAAFGALAQIPGFNDFMSAGGEALANIARIIGKVIGSLIAGIGEGLTSTLPAIGENIAGFTKSLEGANFDVLKDFFSALSEVSGVPASGGIFQMFTGDPYNGLLKMAYILPSLGSAAKEFITNVGTGADFSALSSLLNALSSVGALPSAGGFFQFFTGDPYNGLLKMIYILPGLGAAASAFFANAGGITNFSAISSLLNALSAVSAMPEAGGFFQFFTGDPYNGLLKMIYLLPSLGTAAGTFFANVGGITDFSSISALLNALSSVSAMPESGGFFQFFTGDPYTGLLKMIYLLPSLGTATGAFFANVGGITDFSPIAALLNALSSVKAMPEAGGFFQFFTGDPYTGLLYMMSILPRLGTTVGEFYTNLGGITDFSAIPALLDTLATVKELPSAGGFAQFFTGTPYTALWQMSSLLPGLGKSVKSFYESINGIDDFGKISELFDVLGGLGEKVGTEGGIFDAIGELFGGSEESAIYQLGITLKTFGANTREFFSQVNSFNSDNFNAIFESIGSLEEKISSFKGTITTDFDDIVEKVKSSCQAMLEKLNETLSKIKQTIANTNLYPGGVAMMDSLLNGVRSRKNAVLNEFSSITSSINRKINSVIRGGNYALEQFGSDKKLSTYEYARGTGGHRGGNAIVNDGRGAELVQMPNGNTFIPHGRNVFLPNAPKGMRVLDAQRTAKLFGKSAPTFRYADGTGDIDVLGFEKGSNLVTAIIKKFVGGDKAKGFEKHAGDAAVSTIRGAMSSWGDKLIDELGARGIGDYVASAGVEQWRSTVTRALKLEGQYSAANVKRTLYQMQTESGGNPKAINLWDSNAKKGIPSKGLMQVIDPTFRAYARDGFNKNIYDPLSNILASIRYAVSRYGSLAKAYQGHGYSGGVGFSRVSLPQYTPSSSVTSTSRTETNNYAPSFSITINGADDPRGIERKVKKWVQEAMNETFESIARKSPRLQEV